MNNTIKKVDASIELVDAISNYYDEFHKLLTDKRIADEIDKEIKTIMGASRSKLLQRLKVFESSAIEQLNFEDIVTLVFQTYQLLKEYENLINKIDGQLTDWNVFVRPDLITSDVSQSKLTDISRQSGALSLIIVNFKRQYEDYDIDVIKNLSDYILKKLDIPSCKAESLLYLQSCFRKYPLNIDIYSVLLQSIMDINKSMITLILQLIEQDKTFILEDVKSIYEEPEIAKIKPVQNLSHRYFGLVPNNVFKPLSLLFPNYTASSIDTLLNEVSTKENIAIIYMKKFTAQPIEFSIWKLTRVEDSAEYIQKEAARNGGLSPQLIDRMKVINYIDPPEKSKKWNLSEYTLYGNQDAEFFFILDSFNNTTFRFLRPWTSANPKVPRSHLIGLLNYMGIIKGNKTDRIAIYNELQESVITEHMFLRQPIDVEELVADVQAEMDAPKLKQDLVTMLMKKIKAPKNWSDLGTVIHDSNVIDEFADGLIKLYPVHFKDSITLDKRVQFPFSETLSTFLVELNNVRRSFGRALHDKYVRTPKDMQITAFKNKDNINLFFARLLREALDEVITNKSNVYSSLLMKNKILTIELNEHDKEKKIGGGLRYYHSRDIARMTGVGMTGGDLHERGDELDINE